MSAANLRIGNAAKHHKNHGAFGKFKGARDRPSHLRSEDIRYADEHGEQKPDTAAGNKTNRELCDQTVQTVLLEFFASQDRNPRSGRGFLPDGTNLLSGRLGGRSSSRQFAPLGGDFSSL